MTSWVENGGVLVASMIAGVLLTVSGVDAVFAVMAVVAFASALLVVRVSGVKPVVPDGAGVARRGTRAASGRWVGIRTCASSSGC